MRIKRFMAGLMACMMMTGCVATPAFAYTGGETTSAAEIQAEAETTAEKKTSTATSESETTAETKKDTTKSDKTAENEQPYNVTVNDDGTMTITYNGEEFTLGGDDSETDGSIGTGKVANVGDGSYLNLRDGAGMSANIIGICFPARK